MQFDMLYDGKTASKQVGALFFFALFNVLYSFYVLFFFKENKIY